MSESWHPRKTEKDVAVARAGVAKYDRGWKYGAGTREHDHSKPGKGGEVLKPEQVSIGDKIIFKNGTLTTGSAGSQPIELESIEPGVGMDFVLSPADGVPSDNYQEFKAYSKTVSGDYQGITVGAKYDVDAEVRSIAGGAESFLNLYLRVGANDYIKLQEPSQGAEVQLAQPLASTGSLLEIIENTKMATSAQLSLGADPPADGTALEITRTGGANQGLRIIVDRAANAYVQFGDQDNNNPGRVLYDNSTDSLQLLANSSEGLRIDSGQNVIVKSQVTQPGTSTAPALQIGDSGAGFYVNSSGEVVVVDEAGNTTIIS